MEDEEIKYMNSSSSPSDFNTSKKEEETDDESSEAEEISFSDEEVDYSSEEVEEVGKKKKIKKEKEKGKNKNSLTPKPSSQSIIEKTFAKSDVNGADIYCSRKFYKFKSNSYK